MTDLTILFLQNLRETVSREKPVFYHMRCFFTVGIIIGLQHTRYIIPILRQKGMFFVILTILDT